METAHPEQQMGLFKKHGVLDELQRRRWIWSEEELFEQSATLLRLVLSTAYVTGRAHCVACCTGIKRGETKDWSVLSTTALASSLDGIEWAFFQTYSLLFKQEKHPCVFCGDTVRLDHPQKRHPIAMFYVPASRPETPHGTVGFMLFYIFACGKDECQRKRLLFMERGRSKRKPYGRRQCAACRQCEALDSEQKYLECGHCRMVHYCSRNCQKKMWRYHKTFCQQYMRVMWHVFE